MMTKVVVNACYGGFGLSKKACEMYAERKGLTTGKWSEAWGFFEGGDFYDRDIARDDPDLVAIVEELGKGASGYAAELVVVEVPADANWQISEYDGREWVSEVHRKWG